MDGEDWRAGAACTDIDPSYFFPDERRPPPPWVLEVCRRRCPVRDECLNFALDVCEDIGWFGGVSPVERRKLRRLRRAELTAVAA